MPKRVYLLRHGSTGLDGRFIGSSDVPVADGSKAVLQKTGRTLQGISPDAVLCSPMLRCRQSFKELSLQLEPEIDHALREVDFGDWENKTFHEIAEGYPGKVKEWSSWSEEFAFPGGERIGEFLERIAAVRRKIESHSASTMLIITHGGVIRQLICSLLGLTPENYLLFDVRAGYFSTIELYSQGGVLTSMNSG